MIRARLFTVSVAAMFASLGVAACSRSPTGDKPSILLFVFDTTRADAVSAYGHVHGTTPEFDALAASGLRYAGAYSNAPWTLPSHVTLFSGLLMSQHGVGSRATRAPDEILMLAERLRAVGYETVGFSENPFVTETFNMTQGFERFVYKQEPEPGQFNVTGFLAEWLHQRQAQRPFFLFVNVMDAHEPYAIRAQNAFVPSGIDADAVRAVDRRVHQRICAQLPTPQEIDILKGLYLGGVAVADAKLQAVRAALRQGGLADRLVTIVLSDHGEHFGEHRLMEHNFSVRQALLRVPLAVAGLPGVQPAVIDEPVEVADIVPTVLHWAGMTIPNDLPGRPLPTEPGTAPASRSIEAEYTEPDEIVESGDEPGWLKKAHAQTSVIRSPCAADDRVFGNMVALVRYPFKMIWFERYPAELYDVASDPDERSDLASSRPDVATTLRTEVDRVLARAGRAVAPAPRATVPPEVQERLRALGYLGGGAASSVTPTTAGP